MGSELYSFLSLFNPLVIIFIYSIRRWWKKRQKEDLYLGIFFICLYISMTTLIFSTTFPQEINILVFTNKAFLALGIFSLFMFLLVYFPTLKKFRSFILVHMVFVLFIGVIYLQQLVTLSYYKGIEEKILCYNQNLAFSIAFLSYTIFWVSVVIYYFYRTSLLTEKLTSRVKLHLFIIGIFFTFLGVLGIEFGLLDTRDIYILEVTTKIYGSICHIVAFVLFTTSLFVPKSIIKLWETEHLGLSTEKSLRKHLLIIVVGIMLNVLGGKVTSYFHLPFFADTIGTALVALTLGPWIAATVGLLTNFLLSIVACSAYFPFAMCNIFVGLLWGYFARLGYSRIVGTSPKIFWKKFLRFIFFNGVLVGTMNGGVATIISLAFFGGFSGHGAEFVAIETQKYIGSVAGNFIARVGIESFNKSCAILTALFISLLFFQRESAEFLRPARRMPSMRVSSGEVIIFLLALVLLGLISVPLFLNVLALPPTAIVTPYIWVFLNFAWISITTAIGLVVLYKWTK